MCLWWRDQNTPLCIWKWEMQNSRRKENERMSDRFPKDCWKKKCPHFHTVDMSIDDLVCTCDLLKMQCDACDEDWSFLLCPLPKGEWLWNAIKFVNGIQMLGALSLMEFRAYLKMCNQQEEKPPTLTDSALCLTRNNRVLLEGSGKSKILRTGSNSQRNKKL